ncbi:MAG: hypothetical protein LC808_44760, partial [Actinobacteria bacterium]|nr:hypothetical protein [Actinomycetota bacterium]
EMTSLAECDEADEVLGRTDHAAPVEKVLGKVIRNAAAPEVAAAPAGVKGAVLPFTGAATDIYTALTIAMLLIAAGVISLKLRLS